LREGWSKKRDNPESKGGGPKTKRSEKWLAFRCEPGRKLGRTTLLPNLASGPILSSPTE